MLTRYVFFRDLPYVLFLFLQLSLCSLDEFFFSVRACQCTNNLAPRLHLFVLLDLLRCSLWTAFKKQQSRCLVEELKSLTTDIAGHNDKRLTRIIAQETSGFRFFSYFG